VLLTVTLPLVVVHTPPVVALVRVIAASLHTVPEPLIVVTVGSVPMVMTALAVALPQLVVTVYLMVSSPGTTPVTTPPALMVALPLLALHTPPEVALLKVMVAPVHTVIAPVIALTVGGPMIVIVFVAVAVPQLLLTVYTAVSSPAVTPLTIPVAPMVALLFVMLHTPPTVAFARVMVPPAHTLPGPLIVSTVGVVVTVSLMLTVVVQPAVLVTL